MSAYEDEYYDAPSAVRSAPADLTAEAHLLGAILLNPLVYADVIKVLRSSDFFSGKYRKIFEAMQEVDNQSLPIEPLSVIETLKQHKALESVGGELEVFNLVNDVATSANAAFYAQIIAKAATKRRLIEVGGKIAEIGFDPALDETTAIDQAQALMFEVGKDKGHSDFESIAKLCQEASAYLDKMSDKNADSLLGIPTGFHDLDNLTSGFQGGQLIVLAARPAMGKSTLATNIAQHVAIYLKKPVVMFSLEMGAQEIIFRMLSAMSGIWNSKLQKPKGMEPNDWSKFSQSVATLSGAPLYIDDTPGINIMAIRSKCRRLAADIGDIGLIVVDYLQLMESYKRSEGRVQEVAEFSRGLKILAKELDVPVIALSQLSRKPEERENKRPLLSDLRESGSIEQDADLVMFIYRDEVYNKDSVHQGEAELIVAKHRAGQLATIPLAFHGHVSRFSNVARKHQEAMAQSEGHVATQGTTQGSSQGVAASSGQPGTQAQGAAPAVQSSPQYQTLPPPEPLAAHSTPAPPLQEF